MLVLRQRLLLRNVQRRWVGRLLLLLLVILLLMGVVMLLLVHVRAH
jgi:hypothetical protein